MKPVSDPALLQMLEASQPAAPVAVSDPELLKLLEGSAHADTSGPSLGSEALRVADKTVRGGLTAPARMADFAGTTIGGALSEGRSTILGDIPAIPAGTKEAIRSAGIGGVTVGGAVDRFNSGLSRLRDLATPSEPQTGAGKALGNIGESAVSSILFPGGLTRPLYEMGIGAAAGVGGEIGGAISNDSTLGRLAGGLVGGVGAGTLTHLGPTQRELARHVMRGVDGEDFGSAVRTMEESAKAKMPVNLSQAMPSASNIDPAVALMANHAEGAGTIKQLRDQPLFLGGEARGLEATLPGRVDDPFTLAESGARAGAKVVDNAKAARTEAWRQAYEGKLDSLLTAAERRIATATDPAELAAANASKEAIRTVPETSVAREHARLTQLALDNPNTTLAKQVIALRDKLIIGAGDEQRFLTDGKQLEGALQDFKSKIDAPATLSSDPIDQGVRDRLYKELQTTRSGLGAVNEPYAAGNAAYREFTEDTLNPLRRGPIGEMAGKRGFDEAAAVKGEPRLFTIFDKGTPADTSRILQAERELRKLPEAPDGSMPAGKEIFADSAKTWFNRKLGDALAIEPGASGARHYPEKVGQNLVEKFGDPLRATGADATRWKGTRDVLIGLARSQGQDPDTYAKGFETVMRLASLAKQRPGSVSGISPSELSSMLGDNVFRKIGNLSLMTPLRQPALYLANVLESGALKNLDKWVTTPEGARTMAKLGKVEPYGDAWLTIMATGMATGTSASNAQGE